MPATSDIGPGPVVPNPLSGASRAVAITGLDSADSPLTTSPGVPAAPEGGEAGSTGSIWRLIGRVFVENRLAVVGVVILFVMLVFCFLGPYVYHSDQTSVILRQIAGPGQCGKGLIPGPPCPLGTDVNGYDVLGRLMIGGQTSLEVGLAAAAVATILGVVYGAVAGFVGGWLDAVMMRLVDTLLSIPSLLLLIVFAVLFKPGKDVLILIIGGLAWLYPARLVRGETLTLRTREYVQAVRVMGGTGRRIVYRHIIPNAVGTIVVNATFQVADAILALAALSFLQLGIQLPQTDWGQMLSGGTTYAEDGYWWLILPAGASIVLVVVAFNFVGDALRDSLEVRLQQR
jgi:peptide/nickel transport system permease protein